MFSYEERMKALRLDFCISIDSYGRSQSPKPFFSTDDALFKILYLAMVDATKKMDWKRIGLGPNT